MYEDPTICDYGTLVELTAAGQIFSTEDGAGKQLQVTVDPVAQVTVQLLP